MITETVTTVAGHAGYELQLREYVPAGDIQADVLLLHGVVSHSEWLAGIARPLAERGYRVLCPDRRGVALNAEAPGDTPGVEALLGDVEAVVAARVAPGRPLHFGGFCWGATYAINVLERGQVSADSLLLLAPSIFPAGDVGGADLVADQRGEPLCVPNVPIDRFTRGPAYATYIVPDPLRTRHVSPRFNQAMIDMNRLLGPRLAKLPQDKLAILAADDRLSDNAKHQRAFQSIRRGANQVAVVPGEHGIQFDAPDAVTTLLTEWMQEH